MWKPKSSTRVSVCGSEAIPAQSISPPAKDLKNDVILIKDDVSENQKLGSSVRLPRERQQLGVYLKSLQVIRKKNQSCQTFMKKACLLLLIQGGVLSTWIRIYVILSMELVI